MNGMLSPSVTFTLPKAIKATVTDDTLTVDLDDGRTISVPIGWYPRLEHGTYAERAMFRLRELVLDFIGPTSTKILALMDCCLASVLRKARNRLKFEAWLQKRKQTKGK